MRHYDRRTTLATLADGGTPPTVFGPDRPAAIREARAIVDSVVPDDDLERAYRAWGVSPAADRRHRALTNGRRWLRSAYQTDV